MGKIIIFPIYFKITVMKKLLFYLLVCTTSLLTAQQNESSYRIEVLPGSSLTITGDTNIRDFLCEYDTKRLARTHEVFFSTDSDWLQFRNTILQLRNAGFDCGNRAINRDFHSLLKSDEYPIIDLELKEIHLEKKDVAKARVRITIAGKKKDYEIPVKIATISIDQEDTVQHLDGHLKLNISDFGLQPPKKLFGLIVVKDDIQINFDLHIGQELLFSR